MFCWPWRDTMVSIGRVSIGIRWVGNVRIFISGQTYSLSSQKLFQKCMAYVQFSQHPLQILHWEVYSGPSRTSSNRLLSHYRCHLNWTPTFSSSSLTSRPSWSTSRYLNMVSTSALFSSMSLCWLFSSVFSTLGCISSSMLFSLLYSDMVHALPRRANTRETEEKTFDSPQLHKPKPFYCSCKLDLVRLCVLQSEERQTGQLGWTLCIFVHACVYPWVFTHLKKKKKKPFFFCLHN